MTTVAEVRLWGSTIGAAALEEGNETAAFEYNAEFLQSGIELSPLAMPLSRQVYRFPVLPRETFHGLPGMLADSLPDRFGNAVIDAWLAGQGRTPDSFNAVERLCYTGRRGMGALEYFPVTGPSATESEKLDVERLVRLASEVLKKREAVKVDFSDDQDERAIRQILQVGTSAGGARAKAVIAWNPATNEVRSGQLTAPEGFEYWLLKFDGVDDNRDKELVDPKGYGLIEYAYSLMAREAGVEMSECRLFRENSRNHFMTRRFDRLPNGDKLHMQSLGALAHFDYNSAGAYSYEQAVSVIRRLGLPLHSAEQMFRRMVFNIIARNQDDHVKNIAFLMDRNGVWSLAPAFDVIYSYQPSGRWTGSHQMTINGKQNNFTLGDLKIFAQNAGLKRGRAEAIVEEVYSSVSRWPDFAAKAGIDSKRWEKIRKTFRMLTADG